MPKPFQELQSELLHLFPCLCVAGDDGMGGLNSVFKKWPDKRFVQGEKNTGCKGCKGSFQEKQHPTGFLVAQTTLSSALCLVFKTISRSLMVETVGMVWV